MVMEKKERMENSIEGARRVRRSKDPFILKVIFLAWQKTVTVPRTTSGTTKVDFQKLGFLKQMLFLLLIPCTLLAVPWLVVRKKQ